MELKGQEELAKYIATLIKENKLPRTFILCGPRGCGKKYLITKIQEYLKLPALDITNDLNLETITDIIKSPIKRIYTIDVNNITIKEQNVILKFLEESDETSYVILITDSKNKVIPTVYNRCIAFDFKPYSKEVLREFSDNEYLLNICTTPGQLLSIKDRYEDLNSLCDNIILRLKGVSFGALMTIKDKLKLSEKSNGFDVDIFLTYLAKKFYEKYLQTNEEYLYAIYKLLKCDISYLEGLNLNKTYLVDNLLGKMLIIARKG